MIIMIRIIMLCWSWDWAKVLDTAWAFAQA